MSDEISEERLRETAKDFCETADGLRNACTEDTGSHHVCVHAVARLALRLRAEVERLKARSAELERALREARRFMQLARMAWPQAMGQAHFGQMLDAADRIDAALAAPAPEGIVERFMREHERRETLPRHRCPHCQFEFSDEDEQDAALAAPEPEGSAGDEGSRATGRSPGGSPGVKFPDVRAEAAPADPEELRCKNPLHNYDGTICPDCQPEGEGSET